MGVTLDIIDEQQIERSTTGIALERTTVVDGLDIGYTAGDPSMLMRALNTSGLPGIFSRHEVDPRLVIQRQIARPRTDSSVIVKSSYSGPLQAVGQADFFVITDSTSTIQVTTQIHPRTHQQLSVKFTDEAGKKYDYIVTFQDEITLRTLQIDALLTPGTPRRPARNFHNTPLLDTRKYQGIVNSVNSTNWLGLPVGYWKCSNFVDRTIDLGRTFNASISFETKTIEDWSQYGVIRDRNTGEYLRLDPAKVQAIVGRDYGYNVQDGSLQFPGQPVGIIKVGLKPMVDYGQVFGFGG